MRGFWALPAVLRVAIASHSAFSALDDILSYPQFEVIGSTKVISEAEADAKIAALASRASASAFAPGVDAAFHVSHFRPDDLPSVGASDGDDGIAPIRTYERLRLGDVPYLCSIPYPLVHNESVEAPSPEEQEEEAARATSHGSELLKGMEGSCIFFNTGWWTYSFCYNKSVKQFHSLPPGRQIPLFPPTEDTSVQSFVLGKFGHVSVQGTDKRDKAKMTIDAGQGDNNREIGASGSSVVPNTTNSSLARLERRGGLKYLVQDLTGGSKCDLTGKPRRVEVQFHCAPGLNGDKIAVIKETSTCAYLMIVETSRLCKDLAFQPPEKDKPNPLVCAPVIPNGAELQDFPALASAIEKREQPQAEEPLLDLDYPIYIGDVEFGGNHLLSAPPEVDEGAELEAEVKAISNTGWLRDRASLANSLALGGHREKLVATVASSSMDPLSDAELKKLSIRAREIGEIAKFRKEMEKMSKGKPWRLDVIETAQGREFRGIIEADEKEQDKKATDAPKKGGETGETKGGLKKGEAEAPGQQRRDDEGSEEVYKDEL